MTDLGLNEHHQMIVMNYMKFARYQRNQNLKAIEYAFKDVLDSRLMEDTYTSDEVQELLTGLSQVVRGDIETELISSSHMTILLLKQLFEQAEKWHLRLQADLSELENREQLEVIKALETNEFYVKPEKNPPTPTKIKLEPVSDGSARLLNLEIERLNEENEKLTLSLKESESKIIETRLATTPKLREITIIVELNLTLFDIHLSQLQTNMDVIRKREQNANFKLEINMYLQEISKLKMDLGEAQSEVFEQREHTVKPPEPSQLNEMETQLSEVRNLLATNLESSVSNQQQLETELSTTREKVAEVQAQLSLAEQELERKFSQTAAYANMKKILNKKNDQMKELRRKLQQYEPDEKGEE